MYSFVEPEMAYNFKTSFGTFGLELLKRKILERNYK